MNVLDKLRATVEGFCRFIVGLPKTTLVEQEWGPKEVLAHLVFWHESYVAQIEALMGGAPFELLSCRINLATNELPGLVN